MPLLLFFVMRVANTLIKQSWIDEPKSALLALSDPRLLSVPAAAAWVVPQDFSMKQGD